VTRAAVFIGVSKSGTLPTLQAVADGLRAMQGWVTAQGFSHVETLSDAAQPVSAGAVWSAVNDVVNDATVEQLVVYFAGHGVNRGYSEYWLLSGAPENPNEAVNVAGSVVLAERCGIPHVVIISDACRTAPDTIEALAVEGSEIFPNRPPSGRAASSVDIFYACLLGDPAHEFKRPEESAQRYASVYTDVLVDSLNGKHRRVLESLEEGGRRYEVVRPWPLKRALPDLVGQRLRDEGLWLKISQTPDARVVSDPQTAFLSLRPLVGAGAPAVPPTSGVRDLSTVAARSLEMAMGSGLESLTDDPLPSEASVPGSADLLEKAGEVASSFGPRHFETGAGFKVRGARFTDAFHPDARSALRHPKH